MGIAGALLLVVMIFSTSLSVYEEEVDVGNLNRRLEVVKIQKKSISKKLSAAKKESEVVANKLFELREQLRIEITQKKRMQAEIEGTGEAFEEPALESDEEKAKIIEELKKMAGLETELESLTQEHERIEYLMRARDEEARLRVEELITENNALLEELEATISYEEEEFVEEADSSSLGQMVQELAAENVDLKSRLEAAENALKELEN